MRKSSSHCPFDLLSAVGNQSSIDLASFEAAADHPSSVSALHWPPSFDSTDAQLLFLLPVLQDQPRPPSTAGSHRRSSLPPLPHRRRAKPVRSHLKEHVRQVGCATPVLGPSPALHHIGHQDRGSHATTAGRGAVITPCVRLAAHRGLGHVGWI
jgi:hypothetical protein